MGECAERARALFLEGYNCAQAVVGAFADQMKIDFTQAMQMASSFGAGMGRLREVCGAVSGMFLVAGVLYGYADPKSREGKGEHYARIQKMATRFSTQTGSIVCRELLGLSKTPQSPTPSERTVQFYQKRPCAGLVYLAAQITEELIAKNGDLDDLDA